MKNSYNRPPNIETSSQNHLIDWEKVLQRDRQEFQKFLTIIYPRLRHTALKKFNFNSPELAEEALQDAMLSIYEKIDQFRGDSSIVSWATTIVIRACFTKIRNYLDGRSREDEYNYVKMPTTECETPESFLREADLSKNFWSIFQTLREQDQQILLMVFDDSPVARLHEEWKVPLNLNTIRGRRFAINIKIARLLREVYGDDLDPEIARVIKPHEKPGAIEESKSEEAPEDFT